MHSKITWACLTRLIHPYLPAQRRFPVYINLQIYTFWPKGPKSNTHSHVLNMRSGLTCKLCDIPTSNLQACLFKSDFLWAQRLAVMNVRAALWPESLHIHYSIMWSSFIQHKEQEEKQCLDWTLHTTMHNLKKYYLKYIILTGIPLGPERPLSPGIPAGPCYTHTVINCSCPPSMQKFEG